MTREDHLLLKLAEECNEVAQRVSKCLRFGPDEVQPAQALNNRARLLDEVLDLMAVLAILTDEGILPEPEGDIEDMMEQRRDRIEHYMRYSEAQGRLAQPTTGDFFVDGASQFRKIQEP